MSKLYNLNKKINELINQLRAEHEGISEVDTEFYYYEDDRLYSQSSMLSRVGAMKQRWYDHYTMAQTPQSIKTLLRELNNLGLLGENPDWIKANQDLATDEQSKWSEYGSLQSKIDDIVGEQYKIPKTLAEVLQIKWFNDKEVEGKLEPSLWETDQKAVLQELVEVLEELIKE